MCVCVCVGGGGRGGACECVHVCVMSEYALLKQPAGVQYILYACHNIKEVGINVYESRIRWYC